MSAPVFAAARTALAAGMSVIPALAERMSEVANERVYREARYVREVLQQDGFTDSDIESACNEVCTLPYWREVDPDEGRLEYWILQRPSTCLPKRRVGGTSR